MFSKLAPSSIKAIF
ncbi:hypothetical protein ACRTTH_003106 [Escherichia coli]